MQVSNWSNNPFTVSLKATILAPFLWICMPGPAAEASTVILYREWVDLSGAPGFSNTGQYLAKFGTFTFGFQPNLQNLASWEANFMGGTGIYNMVTKSPSVQFDNIGNATLQAGSTLWLVVYNVEPGAAASTATTGVILRRNDWNVGIASETVRVGRNNVTYVYNYVNWAGGSAQVISSVNYEEENRLGPFDIQSFTSPTHELALENYSISGYDLVVKQALAVPEPKTALLFFISFILLLRSRRAG